MGAAHPRGQRGLTTMIILGGLSAKQERDVRAALKRGKRPDEITLTVYGRKLTLEEYSTVRELQRPNLEAVHTGGTAAGQKRAKRVEGGVINQYGVFISDAERKELNRVTALANRYQEKRQFETTLANVRRVADITAGRGKPSKATTKLYDVRRGISSIRSRSQLLERIEKYKNIKIRSEFFIAKIQKENLKTAYKKTAGWYADKSILRMIDELTPSAFLSAMDADTLDNPGDIYNQTSYEVEEMNVRLKSQLERLLGVKKTELRGLANVEVPLED